ncbi:hypothetical protein RJT34_04776 [Clitoria ternatea]|uniref:non-specific serine/threonine protein kinase n=1 Tax=Clitoria ternatea TaxID=43366 RepID=A0AAN9Q2K9_CLITE
MAAKRFFDDSDRDIDKPPGDKRIRSTSRPSFASVIGEVVLVKNMQNLFSGLEPLLRRVVNEEVELAMRRSYPRTITRSPSLRLQAATEQASSSYQLMFNNKLSLPIFTGSRILDIDGNPIHVLLVDKNSENGQMVPTSLPQPIKLEIVVLDGDFPDHGDRWKSEEFNRHIVKERAGKRPLLTGELNITMRDGIAPIGDIEFTDNSSWIRSRKFRVAVRVAPAGTSNHTTLPIREAITESFIVKDHRGELYKKHHPPMLQDEVWRLEKIGKDGAFHKKLSSHGIKTVQQFLQLSIVDPRKLRTILGVGMSEKMWDVTVKHAKNCNPGNKVYVYRGPNFTIFLNAICQMVKANINGQTIAGRELRSINRSYMEKLVKEAHSRWNDLEIIDGVLNDNVALLTQGETVEQFPNNHQASVIGYDQIEYFGDKCTEYEASQNAQQMGCSDWGVNLNAGFGTTSSFMNGMPYSFSDSQSDSGRRMVRVPDMNMSTSTFGSHNTSSSLTTCPTHHCKNGPKISYPFWLSQGSPPDQCCGYLEFGLLCSDHGDPIFPLPPGRYYYVKEVDYVNHNLKLIDADTANQTCPRALHDVPLSNLPLSHSPLNLNLSFYYNCSHYPPGVPSIKCLSSGAFESFVFLMGNETKDFDWSNCQQNVVVTVMKDQITGSDGLMSEFAGAMDEGFVLEWHTADSCAECEASDGLCGYSDSRKELLCFCKDGSTRSHKCEGGTGSSNGLSRLTIGFIVGGGIGALLIGLLVCPHKLSFFLTTLPQSMATTTQNSTFLTSILITLALFLTTLPQLSYSQKNDTFSICSQSFSCGTLTNVSYPFWGGNIPQICGKSNIGFKLTCMHDRNTSIQIGSQKFNVLSINQTASTMRIVRTDLVYDHCSSNFTNTSLSSSPFSFLPTVQNVTVFYKCPFENVGGNTFFTCRNDSNRHGFYVVDNGTQVKQFQNCGVSVQVQVAKDVVIRGSEDGVEALEKGFDVGYDAELSSECSACRESGGVCGSNENDSSQFSCHCSDGTTRDSECSAHKSQSKRRVLKLVLGFLATAIGLPLIAVTICKNKAKIWKFIKTQLGKIKNERDIEAFLESQGSLGITRYSFSDVKKMTNSFKVKLGEGGYGCVYKGKLLNGCCVAVKLLNESKGNGEEFINEVASISKTSHVNIVTLLGFCLDGSRKALIYEFMPNGSLEKYIHKKEAKTNASLSWERLHQIAIGIAKGLEYLHKGCNTRILHFDIKPHNILLDETYRPKISDFGLAKLNTRDESIISMSNARGTVGYVAPEMSNKSFGGVSHKSDVYSYGMMLLEMVGGQKNINVEASKSSEIYFPHLVIYKKLEQGTDLGLEGILSSEENEIAKRMTMVGLWCIQTIPSHRPTISKVIDMLEGSMDSLEMPPKPVMFSPPRSTTEFSTVSSSPNSV